MPIIYRVNEDGSQVAEACDATYQPGMCMALTKDWKHCPRKGKHNGYCGIHKNKAA